MDDEALVEAAVAGLENGPDLDELATHLALLAEPGRLRLMFTIHRAPGLRVSDLAAIVGQAETTTSHALRLLRASGWVRSQREGRHQRYYLADEAAHDLLHEMGSHHAPGLVHDDEDPTTHVSVVEAAGH